jgi:hypothetical protein
VFVARGGTWSPTSHHHWPDAFKAAVHTFLLAGSGAAGSGSGGAEAGGTRRAGTGGTGPGLVALPTDVLLRIIQQVAAPMSAWL